MSIVAVDIETSGLDPADAEILAVGITDSDGSQAATGDEASILGEVVAYLRTLTSGATLVTWNGAEFDLPFIQARAHRLDLDIGLRIEPTGEIGKYGKPLYEGTWVGHNHVDIAPAYRTIAEQAGIRWSLKPVARHILGMDPIEVDRRGAAIAAMPRRELIAYVCSDTTITAALAVHAKVGLPVR